MRSKESFRKRRAVMIEGPKFPPAPRMRTDSMEEVVVVDCAIVEFVDWESEVGEREMFE